jgi:hypothetical protein
MLLRKRFLSLAAVGALAVMGVACDDDNGTDTTDTTDTTVDDGTDDDLLEDDGDDDLLDDDGAEDDA